MERIKTRWRRLRIKLSHWEYWNGRLVYLPIMPYLLYLCAKARHCFFFTAANPGIENGGLLMESKWKIHQDAPDGFFPDTLGVDQQQPFTAIAPTVLAKFTFPFIAKPDIGSKGSGVSIIHDLAAFRLYHEECPIAYIVQRLVDLPEEAGIFYAKLPGATCGTITGIVQKAFITVTGNGKDTIRALLTKEPRYFLQLPSLETTLGDAALSLVLPAGEQHRVIAVGNHARGSLFTNASGKITPALTVMIDQLCKRFDGFYFGRMDIRFTDWASLEQGKNFEVIELNGSGSEPTHIYDPGQSIFYAWKEITRHWRILYDISTDQHRRGVPYLRIGEVIKLLRKNARVEKLVRAMQ